MTLEPNRNPSVRDLRVFAGLVAAFFTLVAFLLWWKPEGLAVAAIILAAAWLASMIFNLRSWRSQLVGVSIPLLFGAGAAAVLRGWASPEIVSGCVLGGGALLALLVLAFPLPLGRAIYRGWMDAAAPLGWSITRVVLGAVYYLVVTPIGLAVRLTGRDPLQRRFDRRATTYWIERPTNIDPARYFRQF